MILDPNLHKLKKCPECQIPMSKVELATHYGADLIIEQCEKCGGLWFDVVELFSARKGSAKELEELNLAMLYDKAFLPSKILVCPVDGRQLKSFSDRRYPEDLQVKQCALCGGMWLNRGEFHVFEKHREAIRDRCTPEEEREKTPEEKKKDTEFNDIMRQVYEQAMDTGDNQAILQLTEFLAGPKPKMLQKVDLEEEFRPTLEFIFKSTYNGYGFIHLMKYFAGFVSVTYMPFVAIVLIIGMFMHEKQREESKKMK